MGRDIRTIAIIQARMGSTRLPGKVLMDLGGDTVLSRVSRRLARAQRVDKIVVATTSSPTDDAIHRECQRLGVACSRGSEDDVLDRYHQVAREYDPATVVRITSDCPLIDPELVDETIKVFEDTGADYASNVAPRTFPRGLDAEVFTMEALAQAWHGAREPYQREHVTPYFYEHPELFRLASAPSKIDYSRYRWTLDTPEDMGLLREIYARLGNRDTFSWRDVIVLMEREPELAELNSHVVQKSIQG